MKKHALKIAILFILFVAIITYGWSFFKNFAYNRLVFETDIYTHIPQNAKRVINFSRNHHFDEYLKLDTTNMYLLHSIKDYATYPLAIVKFEDKYDLILMKATKEQETEIKNIFKKTIAPHHAPTVKKYKNAEFSFHPISNHNFIITTFYKGMFAVSKDYAHIQNFIDSNAKSNFINIDHNVQLIHYINRLKENSPISFITRSDSTTFALAFSASDSTIVLNGAYFGKLQNDSIKLSYNEMNMLLKLENHYTDSIHWENINKVQIWINKLEE